MSTYNRCERITIAVGDTITGGPELQITEQFEIIAGTLRRCIASEG
nr:hypothetical protein [Gluconobacter cerinus]